MRPWNSFLGVLATLLLALSVSAFLPAPRLFGARSAAAERSSGIGDEKRAFVHAVSATRDDTSTSTDRRPQSNDNNGRRDDNNGRFDNRRPSNGRGGGRGGRGGRGRGGRGGRGGGGGQAALRLVNPFKVTRIPAAPSPPPPRNNDRDSRSQGRGGGNSQGRNSRPGASAGASKGGNSQISRGGDGPKTGPNMGGPPGTDGRRKKARRGDRKGPNEGGDGRNTRKASLRMGGAGRKARAASLTSRRGSLRKRDRSAEKAAKEEAAIERRTVSLPDGPVTVGELAEILEEKPVGVIKYLMTDLGVMASMTQSLDPATCVAVAEGFGRIIGGVDDDDEDEEEMEEDEDSALALGYVSQEEDPDQLQTRPPVVTIMGHVDHGKTSLLDAIRDTRVTAGEAGGITQHIASYQVEHKGKKVTFIDTPGHAAFTDMRERGANITDMVILVVAADDGVKQQTADSIVCARQAGVPLVIAINKIDLEAADPMKVMTELTQYDVLTEEFGGDILSSKISAKQKTNLDDLLDKIMLQAEVQDLKANPDRNAEAIVVEANVERGLGTVATSLVKTGTLKIGDIFVAGETYGKVRTLISTNDGKTRLEEAGPSVPVRIVGFEGIPAAGDSLVVVEDEQTARSLAESRQRISREKSSASYQDNLMDSVTLAFGSSKETREMCVLVKADVQGSAEALTRALSELKLENDEAIVNVKVLVSEAGEVSKSDVAIASVTPGTTVIAFNVPASYAAMEDARIQGIPIEYYDIVYDAIESVESRMQEILSPTPAGEYTGAAVVQEVFNIGGTGNIAGSRCTDGLIRKRGNVRVMRGDKILIETTIKSLRNFKAEADTIEAGSECGIGLIDFEDFEADDVIECYVE
eukprot:CAMPEP_0117056836 /NCGR_PEP_ID=MMETSP0472-20121206/39438_1 /TAXON_ID=693140 ORGANISM="Tiarina fusus, Strain LIS" /NCGR_SAMPLE_ID=MMETSP0472 /ASSEMBLY_ACC=CAM_ASM_000603 /LENGTH=865 /DNA_ID=CAMNT_0004773447 /DNA_START=147 /DNA_END=2744 /DNA_ORIENTATION=+